jgi:hypothetical protein
VSATRRDESTRSPSPIASLSQRRATAFQSQTRFGEERANHTRHDAPAPPLIKPASRPSESQLALCHALHWSHRPRPVWRRHFHLHRPMSRLLGDEKMAFMLSLGHIAARLFGQPHASLRVHSEPAPSSIRRAHSLHGHDNAINLIQFGCSSSRGACAAHACKTSLQNWCRCRQMIIKHPPGPCELDGAKSLRQVTSLFGRPASEWAISLTETGCCSSNNHLGRCWLCSLWPSKAPEPMVSGLARRHSKNRGHL